MKLVRFAAVIVFAALPLCAQAQQGGKAKKATNADAQKVAKMISADKAKLKIYCDMGALAEKAEAAEQKKDTKAAEAIANQMDKMAEQLGPEYIAFMEGLDNVDEKSKEGQAIGKTIEALDEMCAK